MNAADTADAAIYLVGVVAIVWAIVEIVDGRATRKWRKIKRHQPRY